MNLPYEHEPYQIRDLEHLFELFLSRQKEAVILRSRGGSKTHDTMKFCLYLIYLGFEVIYFTANASQMERPKIYMKDLINRSFLKWCITDKNNLKKESVECGLHPLIHTINTKISEQYVGGGSQQVSDHKLKYDMFTRTRIATCWPGASALSVEILLQEDYK